MDGSRLRVRSEEGILSVVSSGYGAALREAVAGMMADPHFALSFADNVVVARSGDLAYETGSYTLTMSNPEGEPSDTTSSSGERRQNGSWKVVLDVPVSDPPAE